LIAELSKKRPGIVGAAILLKWQIYSAQFDSRRASYLLLQFKQRYTVYNFFQKYPQLKS